MTLGKTLVLQPPRSDKLFRLRTYVGGNTCGAIFWTDGYVDAPHLPPFDPFLLRSPMDEQVFWKDEAEVVAAISDPLLRIDGARAEFDHLPYLIRPSESDYLYVAEHMVSDFDLQTQHDRKYFARQQAIYRANDALRLNADLKLSKVSRDNIEEFIDMHVELTPTQQLVRAEYFRELGDFRRAIREIQYPLEGNDGKMQRILQQLILARNSTVERWDFNPYAVEDWENSPSDEN